MTRADSGDRLKVPIVILGLGRVGRALVSAIAARRATPSATTGVDFWVAAVADTSGAARMSPADGNGDGHRRLGRLVMAKARGETLAKAAGGTDASFAEDIGAALSAAEDYGPEAPIVVDATADDTGPLLARLRGRGWRLVLANKLPLTGSLTQWEAVTGLPGSGRHVRWEATVASALPVVTAVRRLALCGDKIHRISGVVSGTIGFIFASIEAGAEASAALAEAVRLGLAEPDPRGDLGGLDTCRKALILARSAGFALEADGVERLPPYPAEWDDLPAAEFLGRLDAWSEDLRPRMARHCAGGTPLRYGFVATREAAKTSLFAASPPLSWAAPTDSIVAIEADTFGAHPLVLSGRGRGPRVTAETILADMLSFFT